MIPFIELPQKTILGGKGASGVRHQIINQFPKHHKYIEGFLGLGRVMCWKKPAKQNFGIEIDSDIIYNWQDAKFSTKKISLNNLSILNNSFFDLSLYDLYMMEDTLLYLDPPYPLGSRSSSSFYTYELTDRQDKQLLDIIKKLTCMVAISTYDNSLYKKALKGWRKIQFKAQTRGSTKIETLYMNYPTPPPNKLHDTRFVGSNKRQREKTKRRLETIKGKIRRLEDFEVARLVSELKKEFDFIK